MNLRVLCCLILVCSLSACDAFKKEKPRIEGERQTVWLEEADLKPNPTLSSKKIVAPEATENYNWPQPGGQPNHHMPPLKTAVAPQITWETDIGGGFGSSKRLLSEPVLYNETLYALNTDGAVTAVDRSTGAIKWQTSVKPAYYNDIVLGGGVSYDDGQLFVTTSYAEVLSLEVETGKILWRHSLNSPSRAAPVVHAGRVFVLTINNETFAYSQSSGNLLWVHSGIMETASILGTGTPAAMGDVVVVPYSSGEIYALRIENGHPLWHDSLASFKRVDSVSSLAHIRARPVITQGKVFVVSHAGQIVTFDLRKGDILWKRPFGGIHPPAIVGEFMYMITTEGHLVCLHTETGDIKWFKHLSQDKKTDETQSLLWAGPVALEGRLLVTSSAGNVHFLSMETGDLLSELQLSQGISISPIVARGTLYFLTDGGTLTALQ